MKKVFKKRGFTLVEIMVSLSVFTVVLLLCVGAISTVMNSNTKTKNRKIVIDNLNFLIESISRSIRFGTNYHCGGGNPNVPNDCPSGNQTFSYRSSNGDLVTYSFSGNSIVKSLNQGSYFPVTSTGEISVNNLSFRVFGSYPYGSDYLQPQVILNISAMVGSGANASRLDLQNTISQRKLDI